MTVSFYETSLNHRDVLQNVGVFRCFLVVFFAIISFGLSTRAITTTGLKTVVGRLQLGNTLVFLFNLIGRNPEVQETLYNEAQSLAPPGCDLTVDDLRKAKYLRACISESFRFLVNNIFKII